MRISNNPNDPGYSNSRVKGLSHYVDIYLDGIIVSHVETADEEGGYVDRINPHLIIGGALDGFCFNHAHIAVDRLFGRVEIRKGSRLTDNIQP